MWNEYKKSWRTKVSLYYSYLWYKAYKKFRFCAVCSAIKSAANLYYFDCVVSLLTGGEFYQFCWNNFWFGSKVAILAFHKEENDHMFTKWGSIGHACLQWEILKILIFLIDNWICIVFYIGAFDSMNCHFDIHCYFKGITWL